MHKVQRILFEFKKARFEGNNIAESSREKLHRDIMILTVFDLEFRAKHVQDTFSKDLLLQGVINLEKGLNLKMLEDERKARASNDTEALNELAQQRQCLTLRQPPYKNKIVHIAFGEALLDYMHKFKCLPDSRKSFELHIEQFDHIIQRTVNKKTPKLLKNGTTSYINHSTFDECYQEYEITPYIRKYKTGKKT